VLFVLNQFAITETKSLRGAATRELSSLDLFDQAEKDLLRPLQEGSLTVETAREGSG
jgi:hypothetical protein